ncbi:hypothetical protein D3C73_1337900 [compost metagenome]
MHILNFSLVAQLSHIFQSLQINLLRYLRYILHIGIIPKPGRAYMDMIERIAVIIGLLHPVLVNQIKIVRVA